MRGNGRIQLGEFTRAFASIRRPDRKHVAAILGMSFCLLSAMFVATALGQSPNGAEGTEALGLSAELIEEANESPTVNMELPAPDLAAARRLPHAELDRAEALDLLESVYASVVEQPAGIFDEMPTANFVSDNAAVMRLSSPKADGEQTEEEGRETGRPVLVESTAPLRVEDESGQDAPVDLSLEKTDGELRPGNPIVATSLPTELHEGVELGEGKVTIGFPEAAPERVPSIVDEDSAFYPSIQNDTDLLVTPTPTGVETITELRAAQAPRTQIQTLSLEEGVVLNATAEGGAEAEVNGRTVLKVAPPTATDAAGDDVPVTLSVSGDAIELAVSPPEDAAYPILVDPIYQSFNWTWEHNSFAGWSPVDHAPGYKALTTAYPSDLWALDLTSGFSGGATPTTGAEWHYAVPRYNTEGNAAESYIESVTLSSAMFLLEGNGSYYPEEIDGIQDTVHGGWISVGSYNGFQGEFAGWSGSFTYPNTQPNVDGKVFSYGLITIENEAQAKDRNAVVGTATVALGDQTHPTFTSVENPPGWWNTGAPVVKFNAVDGGLGMLYVGLWDAENLNQVSRVNVPCTGTDAAPCPRVFRSGEYGQNLVANPATAPEGIHQYRLIGYSPTYNQSTWETVKVKVDHSPPTLALSGTATEQATLGTARPQYSLKYSATDGTREPATLVKQQRIAFAKEDFNEPADVAVDPNETIWVADRGNNQIVHFARSGNPLAHFKAVGTETLSGPSGIASDANGNIWVADTGHNRLVEFNSKGEWLRKVGRFGPGNLEFSAPEGVAVAPNGNVWVADSGNNRVQEMTSTGGFVGSFAAAASPGGPLDQPQAVAVAPNGNVWIADTGDNRIVELSSGGAYVASFGVLGSGPGQFNKPNGIDVDNKGNVYVIDGGNGRVEQLSERGEYLGSFGGEGTSRAYFGASAGIATMPTGEIWLTSSRKEPVAALGENEMQEWNPPIGTRSGVRSVTVKMDGKVLESPEVTCPQGGCPLSGEVTIHSGEYPSGTHLVEVTAIDGVGLSTTKTLDLQLNPPAPSLTLSGTMTEQGRLGTALPHYTLTLNASAEEGTGVSQPRRSTITTEITIDGKRVLSGEESCTTETCPITRGWMLNSGEYGAGPHQVVVTATDGYGLRATKELSITLNPPAPTVSLSGTVTEQGTLGYARPGYSLTVHAAAEEGLGAVPTAVPSYVTSIGEAGNGPLSHPADVVVDAHGNVWVVDKGNNRIEEFNEKGEFVRAAGSAGSGAGQLNSPSAIAIDTWGNLDVADTGNNRVVRFTEEGKFQAVVGANVDKTKVEAGGTVVEKNQCTAASGDVCQAGTAGSAEGDITEPAGIASSAGGGGSVYVVEPTNDRVEKIGLNGEVLARFGSPGSGAGQMKEPTAIAIGPTAIWVADTGNNRIEKWSFSWTYWSQFGSEGTGDGQLRHPDAIDVDPDGKIWVGDEGNSRVQEFSETGELLGKFGASGTGEGQFSFSAPIGLAADGAGNVWVTDPGSNRVQRWRPRARS